MSRENPSQVESASSSVAPRHWLSRWSWLLRSLTKSAIVLLTVAASVWILGFAQRQGWIKSNDANTAAPSTAAALTRYVCPMMCVPPSSKPGRCPVCAMKLEPTTQQDGDGVSFEIEPAIRRIVGIRTAKAKLAEAKRSIRTIGSIEYDQSQLSTIAAYTDGRLEELFADYVGVPVKHGDDLALLYSPELFTAQTEYLANLGQATSGLVDRQGILALTSERLVELGMSPDQIAALRESRKPSSRVRIESPQGGRVIEKLVAEGDYVQAGEPLYRVADLATVWLMLDLFPDDASVVRFGQRVTAQISSDPEKLFVGRVAFIDPIVDKKTRTVRVRVELANPDGTLKPGDYAKARIAVPALPQPTIYDPELAGKFISPMHPQVIRDEPGACPVCDMDLVSTTELGFSPTPLPEQRQILVPRNAVLTVGDDSVIYVEVGPGRFEIRRISVAAYTQTHAAVSAGLEAGEVVATDGNFLLDSQSQLIGNASLLDPSRASPPGAKSARPGSKQDPFEGLEEQALDL